MTGEYNINQDIRPSNFAGALSSGLNAGMQARQDLLKTRQLGQLNNLQQQYMSAPDAATKQGLLQQIAVLNPEHAKGLLAVNQAASGNTAFEGTGWEVQRANLQYQQYLAAGLSPNEAKLKAANDVAATNTFIDRAGNVIQGQPLPPVGQLGNAPAMGGQMGGLTSPAPTPLAGQLTPQAPTPLPATSQGGLTPKMSDAEKAVQTMDPTDMYNQANDQATEQEKASLKKFGEASVDDRKAIYNEMMKEHPELPPLTPEVETTLINHYNKVKAQEATPKEDAAVVPSTSNPYANSPVVQISAAEQAAKKNIDMAGLQPSTAVQLEKDMVLASNVRSQVNDIKSQMKPEYQTFKWQGGMAWNALKDKVNVNNLSPKDKAELADFTTYRASAGQLFSSILKDLSGTAVQEKEMKRAEAYLPNAGSGIFDGDSPIQMQSKIDKFEDFQDKALARLFYIRQKGLSIDKVELDEMPKIMNNRGAEIAQTYQAQGLKDDALKAAVKDQLSKEFGLVR